jgi:hypothetical protein
VKTAGKGDELSLGAAQFKRPDQKQDRNSVAFHGTLVSG